MSNVIIEPEAKKSQLQLAFAAGKLEKKYYNKLIFFKKSSGFDKMCHFYGDSTAQLDEAPVNDSSAINNLVLKNYLDKNKIIYVDGPGNKDLFTTPSLKQEVKNPTEDPTATDLFIFLIRADFLQLMNPGLLSTKTASKQNQAVPSNAGNLTKGTSTSNISIVSELTFTRYVVYKIADLKLLSYVASRVMLLLKQKIDYYNIKLDKPINLNYLAVQIRTLNDAVIKIINDYTTAGGNANVDIRNDYIKIEFSLDDYKFQKASSIKPSSTAVAPGSKAVLLLDSQSGTPSYFNDSTLNSLVFNLSKIYNRYNLNFQLNEKATAPQGGAINSSVFVNADETKMFLNKYLFPRSSIVVNEVTEALIESFLLGDVRLLDDEYYKNYFPTGERFNDAFKNQMQQEMSKQYEAIGDLLGDSFVKGKFQEINSVEDYYEQLLNYIDVDALISLSVKCLLKLIPLQDLLDLICKDVLKAFDDHKEAIVQGLEEMEDGSETD